MAFPVPLGVRREELSAFQSLPSETSPLPVPNPTKSFWIDSSPDANPNAKEGSTGPLADDADVCIIGSGITGISAAYFLAKAAAADPALTSRGSFKIVVLEARDFCSGATGRNGGHLTPAAFRHFHELQAQWGVDDALRAIALEHHTVSDVVNIVQDARKASDVDLVEGGHVDLLLTPEYEAEMRRDYDDARAAGINTAGVQWHTKEDAEKTLGTPYPAVQIPGYNIWPLKFVALLLQLTKDIAAAAPGISISVHTSTPCTRITRSPAASAPRRWSVHTPRGAISSTSVLHATNAYASHLLPFLSNPSTGIVPTRGQVIATRAAASLPKFGFSGNEGLEYWFPRPVRTVGELPLVILGGARECAAFGFGEHDDSAVDPRVGRALRAFLPALFPGKYEEGQEPEMEWTGIMGFTRTGDPLVGPVVDPLDVSSHERYSGQYIAGGYSGHGMPRAFACAEVVVQMIVADTTGRSWVCPDWLPKHYVTWPSLL